MKIPRFNKLAFMKKTIVVQPKKRGFGDEYRPSLNNILTERGK